MLSTWLGEKPLAQRFFGLVEGLNLEKVSPSQWKKLNLIWVLFFAVAGILNIYVAYNYSEKTWATFKVFGLMAVDCLYSCSRRPSGSPISSATKTTQRSNSMWYAIMSEDIEDSLEKRLAARPDHLARLTALVDEGRLLIAGPHPAADSADPGPAGFTGSLIVAEFESLPMPTPGPMRTPT